MAAHDDALVNVSAILCINFPSLMLWLLLKFRNQADAVHHGKPQALLDRFWGGSMECVDQEQQGSLGPWQHGLASHEVTEVVLKGAAVGALTVL